MMRLNNDDRVCIIGGGPGGSLAALHLIRQAQQAGIHLEILIFEPRDFTKPGPGGCNRCAGILSSRLMAGLDSLGIQLPPAVIQAQLNAYTLHLDTAVIQIGQPDPQRKIISVYRGGGPRQHQGSPLDSFDDFLLRAAQARGANRIAHRVRSVSWEEKPVVHTSLGDFPADLLVLATGVNSRPPLEPFFGYSPPPSAIMAQDEILRPRNWPDDQVSAYFTRPKGLIFGAIIPKGRYLNISLLGRQFTRDTVEEFVEAQELRADLAFDQASSLCGCTPRIATGPARNYFGDRWVAVGDAAVTRLYKDGIGSAFFTSHKAMQVAVEQGVSRRAFAAGYRPYCQQVEWDNRHGQLLFFFWNRTLQSPRLLKAWVECVREEMTFSQDSRVHIRILWGMFTGDESYRKLLRLSINPDGIIRILKHLR